MSKRARYDGAYEEVAVFDSEASVYNPPIAIVKRGGLLPADAPARIRDELVKGDEWTLVEQSTSSKTDEKDGD